MLMHVHSRVMAVLGAFKNAPYQLIQFVRSVERTALRKLLYNPGIPRLGRIPC